ncbi:WXG100 family type VII secretion target [Plantactinospora sp. WMMB334]|uniref:WXG100 family type VII secretion target n=1 Tax=Plantactinospora sp. WMMB334 TaxID=3404119 RepID=UPI003B958338
MPDIYNTRMVVPESLEGAGPYINGTAESIIEQLTILEGKLAPIAASWTGEASTYFEDQRLAWNMAADGLFGPEGVLGMIAHALRVNYDNYREAELANTQTWRH